MILGTAQLGLHYGISNKDGQPSIEEAKKLLEISYNKNIRILDTAFAYGDSEKIVGKLNGNRFELISKLPDLSRNKISNECNEILGFLQKTLENTKQKHLYAYLLHTVDNLNNNGKCLWSNMLDFKMRGLTKKIGYSLYSPKQLDFYFKEYKPDIVQIPMNILDREFQRTGWLKKLKDNGVEIHIRSVFLQGLLLMDYKEQMLKFPTYQNVWISLKEELIKNQVSVLDYCLGFIKGIQEVDEIVVGANSSNELEEILESKSILKSVPSRLASSDERLIYPFNWR